MAERDTAARLLKHYFRLVAQRAGVQWDSDNDAEVESIVEALIAASVQEALEKLETDTSAQNALAQAVEKAQDRQSAWRGRAAFEAQEAWLRQQDFTQQPAQDATQEDATQEDAGAHVVRLRYVAKVEDALADCYVCGSQIGVLLWENGRSFVQECPACGALLRAWRKQEGDAGDGDICVIRAQD